MRGREEAEVLIVGAGPAGSSLAARLAGEGLRPLLLDERAFPRSKPCGDCVSPGAAPLLAELGLEEALAASGAAALRGWRLRSPAGRWFEGRFGDVRPGGEVGAVPGGGLPGSEAGGFEGRTTGPALPRRELDALILRAARAAGAAVLEGVRVTDLLRDGERVTGVRVRDRSGREGSLRARLVIGADGLRSTVARRVTGVRRGRRRRLAMVARYEGGPEPGDSPLGEMRISREGCLGMAPLGRGRWNVTLVVPASRANRIAAGREAFFEDSLAAYGAAGRLGEARRAGTLQVTGPFEASPRRVTVPGAILVGDAAGYFDPFTGQGIYRALAGARLAASCVREALTGGPAAERAARRRYERALDALLVPSRRVQRLVDLVLHRPRLLEPAARLLAAAPGLADLLVEVTGDMAPAGVLLDPRRLGAAVGTAAARAAATAA